MYYFATQYILMSCLTKTDFSFIWHTAQLLGECLNGRCSGVTSLVPSPVACVQASFLSACLCKSQFPFLSSYGLIIMD